jgi:Txe/YoeB family toxin of Txe-Axe toxin-antitoxin module
MTDDNVVYLPVPEKLTPEQKEYWERVLEDAERLRENALRMLGRLPPEKGLRS